MSESFDLTNPNVFPSLQVFDANPIRFQDFQAWAQSLDVGSERTIETYSRNILRFYEYMQVNGISKPTKTDIIAYRDYLKETKKPSTVQGYMAAIKLFFRWTEENGLYPDISKNVKSVKVSNSYKKDPLTVNQVKQVLESIDRTEINGSRDYALILLLVTTGLREISVMNANIEDIHTQAFDNPESGETEYKTYLYYKSKGHTEKDLFVIVPPATKTALDTYFMKRRMNGGTTSMSDPLFTSLSNNNREGRLTTRSIRRIVTKHFNDANLDLSRISAHSLRHSFATINLLSGGSLEETQKALGHANINTTMIYNHAITEANNRSTARVADALFPENKI